MARSMGFVIDVATPRPILTLFLLFSQLSKADISPMCHCVIYESHGPGTAGYFTSPNFPEPYRSDIGCILYTFAGDINEIVQLKFLEFDVQGPDKSQRCRDYVKMFLHLPKPGVNEFDRWDDLFCGRLETNVFAYHHSSTPNLVFEFHSDSHFSNSSGFKGQFKFLPKRYLRMKPSRNGFFGSAVSQGPTNPNQCQYKFDVKDSTTGHFFSPKYPNNYPNGIQCVYSFKAKRGQVVRILFQRVTLNSKGSIQQRILKETVLNGWRPTEDDCWKSADRLVLYDGSTISAPELGKLCGRASMVEFRSTSNFMTVEFLTDTNGNAQGFAAMYTFDDEFPVTTFTVPKPSQVFPTYDIYTLWYTDSNPTEETPTTDQFSQAKIGEYPRKSMSNCPVTTSQDGFKVLKYVRSPKFPDQYVPGEGCSLRLVANKGERVQAIVKSLDLFVPGDELLDGLDCHDIDNVAFYSENNGREVELHKICGTDHLNPRYPGQPLMLMSANNVMRVEFTSLPERFGQNRKRPRGFEIEYKFRKDYGITRGLQNTQNDCAFDYDSSVALNGTIHSPNYPGFYPRNTVCNYNFIGGRNQKLRLNFTYFDVEGMDTCTQESDSDYVIFSNFRTRDRSMMPFCGASKPRRAESDNSFFRVTFYSNHIYDGTGFSANYEFFTVVDRHYLSNPADPNHFEASTASSAATPWSHFERCCLIPWKFFSAHWSPSLTRGQPTKSWRSAIQLAEQSPIIKPWTFALSVTILHLPLLLFPF